MKKSAPSEYNKSKGFTLIELLVVISIIAILSVIGITVFSGVQKNARDAKRRADIESISKALEVHYGDTTCGATEITNYCAPQAEWFASGSVPQDPRGTPYAGGPSNDATFTLKALLENGNGNCQTTVANDSYCISQQQ